MSRAVAATIAALMLLPALGGCGLVADRIDRMVNPVFGDATAETDPPDTPHHVRHERMFVADLHADTLLWERDVVERSSFGHVDLPRLRDGGVDLQVFTVVTKTPRERPLPGKPGQHCVPGDGTNMTALLSAIQLRPVETWFDLERRTRYQVRRLKEAAARSSASAASLRSPELVLIRTVGGLGRLTEATARGEAVIGAVLGVEGVHWLEDPDDETGAAAAAERLFEMGVRQVAPTHRFDNTLAGASEGCAGGPLTLAGRAFLGRAEALGMIVDLAHASPRALLEALAGAPGEAEPVLRAPVVISHTGVKGSCKEEDSCYSHRNLGDDEIRAVAINGGIIGIGYWPAAVGHGYGAVLAAMAHVHAVLAEPGFVARMRESRPDYDPTSHIALGSDFDGAVAVPFDASGVPLLTWRMLRAGFTEAQVRRIAGANVCRVLSARLPAERNADRNAACPP